MRCGTAGATGRHGLLMKIFHTDQFTFPLPPDHRFPVEKYALLRARVQASDRIGAGFLVSPHAATADEILQVHDPEYIRRLDSGEMTAKEMRRVGLPWSPELVERAKRSAGATVEACFAALDDGVAVNLSGGTHHAFRNRGEGYCLLNDSAIAARTLQNAGRVATIAIIDCDVHQGNGTAALLADDPRVFTFSIHGRNNFPYRKEKSDMDIALEDATGDERYLRALKRGLDRLFEMFVPQLVIYLAGADPYRDDRFGRMALTRNGLAARDRLVLDYCRRLGLPAAVTMAGGYARNIADTVDIHFQTVKTALGAPETGIAHSGGGDLTNPASQ
jgi:acetoin utilization deacetylase AcuC-like enzyme